MKINLSRKVTALILSVLMLFTYNLPIYAIENYGSFSGKITAPVES